MLAPIAKAIIAAHYGRKPDFSYMFGCSNGGRHAVAAVDGGVGAGNWRRW